MGYRRIARECALQMLYEMEIGHHAAEDVLESFWLMRSQPDRVQAFANRLFEGTVDRLPEIDGLIQEHTKHWRMKRLAAVDRNILRLAVYEILSGSDTPGTVVINEALEIAKKYSTQDSAQFVNGVLDSVKNDLMRVKEQE
jgi:transcription antitermination protein NusB